jgi:beta-galactosidase/beta-glucuronidase
MMLPVVQALDGEWQLRMTEHDAGDAAELISLEEDWMPATVPGDVHQALMDAGVIADVHIGSNAMECQWVSQKDWWLRKRFVAPEQLGDYTELQMDGLDVYATIWLNGVELGKSDNAFLQWRKRVDEVIKRFADDGTDLRLTIHLIRQRYPAAAPQIQIEEQFYAVSVYR